MSSQNKMIHHDNFKLWQTSHCDVCQRLQFYGRSGSTGGLSRYRALWMGEQHQPTSQHSQELLPLYLFFSFRHYFLFLSGILVFPKKEDNKRRRQENKKKEEETKRRRQEKKNTTREEDNKRRIQQKKKTAKEEDNKRRRQHKPQGAGGV